MSGEKQIDGIDLAVLNCFRNKYYTDGNATENGLVANAINAVLPVLVSLKNSGCSNQRYGEWEKASEYMPIYRCSICKERNLFKDGDNVFSNYCPHCGAKMDRERKEK
jgi:DNA-directed RNA polymerase subunit RPC12/RpoP